MLCAAPARPLSRLPALATRNITNNITRTGTYAGLAVPGTGKASGYFTLPDMPSVGAPLITTHPVQSGLTEMGSP